MCCRSGSPASFIGSQVGGRSDYNRLDPLFPFSWAFIITGHLPAPRWLWAPLPSHLWGFASFLQSPMLGVCICVRVCVSPVSGPSPVIQASPPAMLSHDLIRRRGEAGSHHHRALPGSCHLSPACLDPVSGGEMGWETRQPPTEVTLLRHTPRHTRSWPWAGCWEDSKYQAPIPPENWT